MRIVKGRKAVDTLAPFFENLTKEYKHTVLDLGTGDGKFIYKSAKSERQTLFVGMDPAEKQIKLYSGRAEREKLENALFVIGSIENVPPEFNSKVDFLYLTLPWGTLLQGIVNSETKCPRTLASLLTQRGQLQIILGYSPDFEPSEARRLNLPEITESLLRSRIIPKFLAAGLAITSFSKLDKAQLKNFETTWAKKLAWGKERPLFKLVFGKAV